MIWGSRVIAQTTGSCFTDYNANNLRFYSDAVLDLAAENIQLNTFDVLPAASEAEDRSIHVRRLNWQEPVPWMKQAACEGHARTKYSWTPEDCKLLQQAQCETGVLFIARHERIVMRNDPFHLCLLWLQ